MRKLWLLVMVAGCFGRAEDDETEGGDTDMADTDIPDQDGDGVPTHEDCDDQDATVSLQGSYEGTVNDALVPHFCNGYCTRTVLGDVQLDAVAAADLEALSCLDRVEGNFTVGWQSSIPTMRMASLTSVAGEMWLEGEITEMAFPQLENVGSTLMLASPSLSQTDFPMLIEVGELYLSANGELEEVSGFSALRIISGDLSINYHAQLSDLGGLHGLQSANDVTIFGNPQLPTDEAWDLVEAIDTVAGETLIDDNGP